jgi:hypothetical protein
MRSNNDVGSDPQDLFAFSPHAICLRGLGTAALTPRACGLMRAYLATGPVPGGWGKPLTQTCFDTEVLEIENKTGQGITRTAYNLMPPRNGGRNVLNQPLNQPPHSSLDHMVV